MKTSRLAHGANLCGATHPCASASTRPAPSSAQLGRRIRHLAAALCLGAISQTASAASVKLAWNQNPEPDIADYKLSYGTRSGSYSNTVDAGGATTATVSGLTEGQTYYFVVKAVNTEGLQSEPSTEISYQVPGQGTTPGSLISQAGWTVRYVDSEEPPQYAASLAFDGDPNTFWHTAWIQEASKTPPPHELQIDLGVVQPIGGFRYLPRQDGYNVGNIAQYEFYVSQDGSNWGSPVASGVFANTNSEKEVLFTSVSGRYVKLRQISEANGETPCSVAELNIVTGETPDSDPPVVDPEPTPSGQLISQSGWALDHVSSEEPPQYAATLAFDGNPATFWHTQWINASQPPPHEIAIDLGVVKSIGGFRYLPRQDGYDVGNIAQYEFYVSLDGSNWGSPVASGVFANTATEKEVLFPSTNGRFVKLREITEVAGRTACSIAELNIIQGETNDAPPVPVNQAPVAAGRSANTAEDQTVTITLSASDADGDPLSFSIVSGPAMGALSGTAPNLTYTPAKDANGSDSFTFRVNDGKADSNTATVSIEVAPVNDAPVAAAQLAATAEDRQVGILLSASDKDGDSLSYHIVSNPTKGSLSGSAPNLTYTPNPDASGSDSFSFRANDGTVNSNTATVAISISPVNDAPVAAAQALATAADQSILIVLSASDPDGDPLTFSIVGGPAKGSLSGSAPNLTYIPRPDASGTDSFSFRASDGKANSNTATVSITITAPEKPENKAPVFQADQLTRANGTTDESYTAESLAGSAVDPDGDVVVYAKTAGPDWLTVSPEGGIAGTPPTEAEGLNSFTIRAADPDGAFAEVVLEITIDAADELPLPWSMERIGSVAQDATASGENASSLKVKSNGSLSGREDSGIVTWQTLSGDGEIIARITSLENADSSSRIGLMIRDSLAPNSKHIFIGADGNGSLRFIRRSRTGGSTSLSNVGIGKVPDLWLRLVRSGNNVYAYNSKDGSNWKQVGSIKLPMGSSGYIGLMVSGGGDTPTTGIFQDVTVTP